MAPQTTKRKEQLAFIAAIAPAAQAGQQEWGVPASITMAQAILESGWGKTQLATEANNFFGIKAMGNDDYAQFNTTEFESGKAVRKLAKFAKYPSAVEGFDAHARLLATLPRYAPCMAAANDPLMFAIQLRACGYCTLEPVDQYPNELAALIKQFNLTQYDKPAA